MAHKFYGDILIKGSVSEGLGQASGQYSHAEGEETKALGKASHAEGYSTETTETAPYSHVGGYQNKAMHQGCFLHGTRLISGAYYQTVVGKFNKTRISADGTEVGDSNALFIVGGGTLNNRKDVFAVTAGGVYHFGDVALDADDLSGLKNYNGKKGTIEERLTQLGFNEVSVTYNFGMEKGTAKETAGYIRKEGRFCEIYVRYGNGTSEGTSHTNNYVCMVSGGGTRTLTSTIAKPDWIPSGINRDIVVSSNIFVTSVGGAGLNNIALNGTMETTNTNIIITVVATSATQSAFYHREIAGTIFFSWSDKFTI